MNMVLFHFACLNLFDNLHCPLFPPLHLVFWGLVLQKNLGLFSKLEPTNHEPIQDEKQIISK